MNAAQREAVAAALVAAAETLAEPISDRRLEGYLAALDDLPGSAVVEAVAVALRQPANERPSRRAFPLPSDLRDLVLGGGAEARAELAWRRVLVAIEQVGTTASVDFGDPVLHAAVVDLGGWADAWRWERLDERDLGFLRAGFVRLYRLRDAEGASAAPPILQGRAARENSLTRGSWTRGTDHVDDVLAIGPGGESRGPAALSPAASRRALPAGNSA